MAALSADSMPSGSVGTVASVLAGAGRSMSEVRENVAAAAMAGLMQPTFFNPLDTLKVRWQVSKFGGTLRAFASDIVMREGLWRGLWRPGLLCNQLSVALSQGMRLGLYPVCRDLISAAADGSRGRAVVSAETPRKTPARMLAAGLAAGSAAYFVAAPGFLAKTRIQASAQLEATTAGAIASITAPVRGSITSYWRGSGSLVLRGALLTSGQMLGYDGTKTVATGFRGVRDGPTLHCAAGIVAGLVAATFSAPADVLVTRYQCTSASGGVHRSVTACAAEVMREGGPQAFYRGWSASFARFAPTFIVGGMIYEQARRALGLSYMN